MAEYLDNRLDLGQVIGVDQGITGLLDHERRPGTDRLTTWFP